MGLNQTASAERIHIGFFGLRNAGKSSLVNAVTGQETAVVSQVKGTTTDPVKKAMELLPLGPVVIIDTPGLDDEGDLGQKRVERAIKVLNYTDIAVLVVDAKRGMQDADRALLTRLQDKNIPYVIAYNKADLLENHPQNTPDSVYVSAQSGEGVDALKEMLGRIATGTENQKRVVADLLKPGDTVVLVVPIDSAAPKGRLILPQQQTIRDILEAGATAVVTRETELACTLTKLSKKPKLVITDSQVFGKVAGIVPEDILLTSFSILFARYKGNLAEAVRGAAQLDKLKDGDTVLISEGCTHHRQCEDIGTVKLPGWVGEYTGRKISFAFTSGGDFPEEVSSYALVIHCGGCMLNEREMLYRIRHCGDGGVPITNYGIAIAHMNGILRRSLAPFPVVQALLDE
ncbi:MAG: [FeFe] hydrogenase H-cluster maturation GTPase HydF [Ruminococcaceae bacterium]|nr:[FeFe] hydrogenase H-cluster maturation GTPase HydF [Oscillospiraceae bacterium]